MPCLVLTEVTAEAELDAINAKLQEIESADKSRWGRLYVMLQEHCNNVAQHLFSVSTT